MNPNKSVCSDVPGICFVKFSAKIISPCLSRLYNKCIEYGVFPDSLKFSKVIPNNKSGKQMTLKTTNLFLFYPHIQFF